MSRPGRQSSPPLRRLAGASSTATCRRNSAQVLFRRPYFDRPGKANNLDGSRAKPDYRRYQYGGDVGGPIIPGLLHFFVAFEGTDQKSPSTTVNVDPNKVPASVATTLNGSYPQTFKQKLYFGKLSLFATPNDTIDASGFIRKERNLRDFGGNTAPSHGHDITSDGRLYQLEWRHRATDFNNDMILAYNTFTNGTPRVSDGPEIVLLCQPLNNSDPGCGGTPNINSGSVAFLGASDFVQNDRQKTWTFKDVATFNRGAHNIKAGIKLTKNTYERLEDSRSNGSYYFNSATYTGFSTSTPIAAPHLDGSGPPGDCQEHAGRPVHPGRLVARRSLDR